MQRQVGRHDARLDVGRLRRRRVLPGADGDVVIWDPSGHTSIGVNAKHHMNIDHSSWEGYEIDGKAYAYLPAASDLQARAKPVYETLEGWSESTQGARSWAQLPATAIKYVRRVEELIEVPVALLSTSPERDDTILVKDPFAD